MIGIIVMLVGAAMVAAAVFFHLRARAKAQQSQSWPTVSGTVTASQVVHKRESDSDGADQDVYYAQPNYSYAVNGRTFEAKRVSFGGQFRFFDRAKAEAIVARYPAGATVAVRYNPDSPGEAALESAAPPLGGLLVVAVAGLVLAVVGFIFI